MRKSARYYRLSNSFPSLGDCPKCKRHHGDADLRSTFCPQCCDPIAISEEALENCSRHCNHENPRPRSTPSYLNSHRALSGQEPDSGGSRLIFSVPRALRRWRRPCARILELLFLFPGFYESSTARCNSLDSRGRGHTPFGPM